MFVLKSGVFYHGETVSVNQYYRKCWLGVLVGVYYYNCNSCIVHHHLEL